MSERINHRPELGRTLLELSQYFELFQATENNPELQQLITTAIMATLAKVNLEEEELTLARPTLITKAQPPQLLQRKNPTLPPRALEQPRPQPPQVEEPTDRITEGYTGFYLCSASEGRLLRSLEDTGIVLVNGFLLAKMVGKISALALETKEGFKAGHWYAPRTSWMREEIRQAFDKGLSKVTIDNDVWDYMREAEVRNLERSAVLLQNPSLLTAISTQDGLLEFCKQVVGQLPDQLGPSVGGMSRVLYRARHREGV
jgi:hypothetical protein